MVTVGRVPFAAVGRWLPERTTYRILPFVLVGTFLLTGVLSRPHAVAGIAAFALAGLGCSALLPLTSARPAEDRATPLRAGCGDFVGILARAGASCAMGIPSLSALSQVRGLTM
jgi:hypothetical protein